MPTYFLPESPRRIALAFLAGAWGLACGSESEMAAPQEPPPIQASGPRAARIVEMLGIPDPVDGGDAPRWTILDPAEASVAHAAGDGREIVIDVHQVEEGHALLRQIAALAGRTDQAERRLREIQAPLSERAAHYLGRRRPCVAVLVDLAPLTLAGGHSFETDLVQVLGAESATHGGEAARETIAPEAFLARPLDLVIATGEAMEAPALFALLERRLDPVPMRTAPTIGDVLWLGEPAEIRHVLDAWAPPLEEAHTRPPTKGSCARSPRPNR